MSKQSDATQRYAVIGLLVIIVLLVVIASTLALIAVQNRPSDLADVSATLTQQWRVDAETTEAQALRILTQGAPTP
jgi:uncharacterized membrane protein YukC